ncbi:MAG: hypothetical protein IJR26_01050 [Bacteroidales bacterium]|nr:hypothetical protein [Bacteroidales bacterium]
MMAQYPGRSADDRRKALYEVMQRWYSPASTAVASSPRPPSTVDEVGRLITGHSEGGKNGTNRCRVKK